MAFQFPANPDNGDKTTNPDTGTTYVYQNPPGKWVVETTNLDTSYVAVAGDTMTGPLIVEPVPEANSQTIQNAITAIAAANTSKARGLLATTKSGVEVILTTGEGDTKFTGRDIIVQPNVNLIKSSFPGFAGFQIKGRVPGSIVVTVVISLLHIILMSNDLSGTEVHYFGGNTSEWSIVNKRYVDGKVSNDTDETAVPLSGGTISSQASLQLQRTDGNLTIQQGKDENDNNLGGFFQVLDNPGTVSFSVGPNGRTETREDIFMVNTEEDSQRLLSFGTTNHKLTIGVGGQIAAGSDTPVVINQNFVLTYGGTALNGFGVTFNEDQQREQAVTFNPSKFHTDYYQPFTIQGVQTDDPQNRLLYATVVPAMDFDVSAARDELYYFGSTNPGKSVQTRDSVQAMLNASAGNLDNYYTKTQTDSKFLQNVKARLKDQVVLLSIKRP